MSHPKITYAVKSAVRAYLMARAHAELQREKVDKIERAELETFEFYVADDKCRRGRTKERITDPKNAWLMTNEDWRDYYKGVKFELIKAGYDITVKPGDDELCFNCPACVAETLQRNAEHLVIYTASEMLGKPEITVHGLLCLGIDEYKRFIDLVVGMVVNMPDFKNPLTGKMAA